MPPKHVFRIGGRTRCGLATDTTTGGRFPRDWSARKVCHVDSFARITRRGTWRHNVTYQWYELDYFFEHQVFPARRALAPLLGWATTWARAGFLTIRRKHRASEELSGDAPGASVFNFAAQVNGSKTQNFPKWLALVSGNMGTKTCGLPLLFLKF